MMEIIGIIIVIGCFVLAVIFIVLPLSQEQQDKLDNRRQLANVLCVDKEFLNNNLDFCLSYMTNSTGLVK